MEFQADQVLKIVWHQPWASAALGHMYHWQTVTKGPCAARLR